MPKIKVGIFICFLLMLTLSFSCKKVIQNEFPDIVQTPVVNSIIKADSTISVNVSLSGKLDETKLEFVDNAVVTIFIDGYFAETLTYDTKGMYRSSIIAEPGKKYSCKVEVPGYEVLNCSTNIPAPMEISSVEHKNIAYVDAEGTLCPSLTITFDNNPDTTLYFEVLIKLFEGDYPNEISDIREAWLVGIEDPVLLNEGLELGVFSNEMISGDEYTMTINYFTGGASWNMTHLYPLIVELRTVSYEYYNYIKSLYLFQQGIENNNLSGTTAPLPVYSNVTEGIGIFAGYSSFSTDTVFPENYQIY